MVGSDSYVQFLEVEGVEIAEVLLERAQMTSSRRYRKHRPEVVVKRHFMY